MDLKNFKELNTEELRVIEGGRGIGSIIKAGIKHIKKFVEGFNAE